MKKILYIEPYVKILISDSEILFYNTLNSSFLVNKNKYILSIFQNINNKNNYHTVLLEERIKKPLTKFIFLLKQKYMADIIVTNNVPIIFPEILEFNFSLSDIDLDIFPERDKAYINSNLTELTIVLNNLNTKPNILKYIYQNPQNKLFEKEYTLSEENIEIIYNYLKFPDVKKINIIASDYLRIKYFDVLIEKLNKSYAIKIYYFDILQIIKHKTEIFNYIKKIDAKFSIIKVIADNTVKEEYIKKVIELLRKFDFEFDCIICSKEDINLFQKIEAKYSTYNFNLKPFFNNNLAFFEKYLFLDEKDIQEQSKFDKKGLFIQKLLNKNYFGKLIFFSDGNIYSNIHNHPIGETIKNDLHKVIYHELENGAWLQTRKDILPCEKCIYNIFCPPLSNYESAIGKNNLCKYHE